jgi:hypothetical protein
MLLSTQLPPSPVVQVTARSSKSSDSVPAAAFTTTVSIVSLITSVYPVISVAANDTL